MKRTALKSLAWLMMCLCALTFSACSSDDGNEKTEPGTNGGTPSNPNEELAVNIQNLAGTWQAISAKGTDSEGKTINTKTLSGLDSLDVPVLMNLKSDMTFVAYTPRWNDYNGQYTNSPNFTWKKGDGILPNGDGSILLVGKQLQLIDSYRDEYAISVIIQSLTSKRLTVYYSAWGESYTVIYGRDGDGVDYFSSSPSQKDDGDTPIGPTPNTKDISNLYGTWEVVHSLGYRYVTSKQTGETEETDSWDEDIPAGHIRTIFNSDGTWKSMEYSDSEGTWHEEFSGTFYMSGNELIVTGMEQFSINHFTDNELTVEYMTQEDKGSIIVQKYYHDTLRRIN